MQKSEIGKVLSFKFPKRKSKIQGIVLNYNQEWTLVKRIVDYSTDGFTIFKNEKVKYQQSEHDKFTMKILKIKNCLCLNEEVVPIDFLENILKYVDNKFKLIQLDTKDGEACDIAKYSGIKNNLYLFDTLDTKAKWTNKLELPEKEIRYINFDNNYVNSLKLVTKFKNRVANKISVQ